MKKNRGTSFGELMIVFLIISVGLIIFLKISSDYIKSLVFAKDLFVLNSLLHEKYQFLIAYRNKSLEREFLGETISIVPMPSFNFRCIDFNTSTGNFDVSNSSNCQVRLISGKNLPLGYAIVVQPLNDSSYQIQITGSIRKWHLTTTLEGILTPWHPAIQ